MDHTGEKFGRLTIIGRGPDYKAPGKGPQPRWNCQCECGKVKPVSIYSLRVGHTKSCGCLASELQSEKMRGLRGSKGYRWNGGKSLKVQGYVVFNTGPNKNKFEHRVIMASHLGRDLLPDETVHHKNGIKTDNRIENLELFDSPHTPGQKVSDLTEWAIQHLKLYAPEKLK